MKRHRGWSLFLCFLAGCSTHPLVDTLDFFKPGKLYSDKKVQPYGGVAIPQGPIVPVAPVFPAGVVPLPPGSGAVPPPAPLPGNQPFQLQPPTGDIVPPLPPPPPRSF
jgi:hypothetical protein